MGPKKVVKKLTPKTAKSKALKRVIEERSTEGRKIWDKDCDKTIAEMKKEAIKHGNVSIHICVGTDKGMLSQLITQKCDISHTVAALLSTVHEKNEMAATKGILIYMSNLK